MDEEEEQEQLPRNLVLSVCDLKQNGEAPTARCGARSVTMEMRMYLFGGADEKGAYDDLHSLDIQQMKWSQLATSGRAPSPRYGHSLEAFEQELLVFGGMTASGTGPAPPFCTGPWHGGTTDNDLFKLQTQSLIWEQPSTSGQPPSPRCFHSARMCGSSLAIFGGVSTAWTGALNDLHLLDLRSLQWTQPEQSGPTPSPRYAHQMVWAQEKLLVFGGCSDDGVASELGSLFGFSPETGSWELMQVAGTPPMERAFHSFDLIGNRAYVFAGATAGGASDLYVLDVPNLRWQRPLYEGAISVRCHAAAVLGDKLMIFGGVRDRSAERDTRISKKLFFLNVLEVKATGFASDFKFKLVTVGDSGVGKSCLLTRFVNDFYSDFHVSTIGVDFKTVVTMVKGKFVKLQLWDTAGQERFSVVTGNYYRNSDGFIFVFDATSRESFDHVEQWITQVQQHHDLGPSTIKILLGNKYDLGDQVKVTEEEGAARAKSMGALFVATSAKTAANVDMAFLTAAQQLVEERKKKKAEPKAAVGLQLGSGAGQPQAKSATQKCCTG